MTMFAKFTGASTGKAMYVNPDFVSCVSEVAELTTAIIIGEVTQSVTVKESPEAVVEALEAIE
jgi:hypothetical protein